MTSGTFASIPINEIWVDRADRHRRELRNIEELAESISRLGLIHPPVISHDGRLIAGERRWTACKALGWTAIPVQYVEDLDEYQLQSIELEENVKRLDLTWQERVMAIEKFHKLQKSVDPEWTDEQTAEALGYARTSVSEHLTVAAEMSNEAVATSDRFAGALNIVRRNSERKKASTLDEVSKTLTAVVAKSVEDIAPGEEPPPPSEPEVPILNTSFHEWQESYAGPKFNLIHCDFPYGINVADSPRMDATIKDHYDDSPDVYWNLLDRLRLAMDNVVAESAHLIFWHSMKFHSETKVILEHMGWKVNPFPLIWHKSDGSGIAPDPQRGPRQTYEAAIFASRGDRKITQAGCVANSFAHPGRRDGAIHVSEKPYPMLHHFLRMVCDEYSYVLDPTCGSANALKVAEALGAGRVLGIEQSTEFYDIACANWNKRDV